MAGKRVTPEQKAQAIAMRRVGYTLAAIADRTYLSVRTLARLFEAHQTSPEPLSDALVEEVRAELLQSLDHSDELRVAIASAVADDLAITRAIREKLMVALDQLNVSSGTDARASARALAQLANALKSTQVVGRTALGIENFEGPTSPTVLEIREFTEQEMQALRESQSSCQPGLADA